MSHFHLTILIVTHRPDDLEKLMRHLKVWHGVTHRPDDLERTRNLGGTCPKVTHRPDDLERSSTVIE